MSGMFDWLARHLDDNVEWPPFVLAGVMHYGITDIHPFADGNGRAARLFQTAVLMKLGVLPGRMFSFERYYAEDREAYYDALRSVRRNTLNMNEWMQYFLRGLSEEYERIAATVEDLSALTTSGAAPVQLSAVQQNALTALRLAGRHEFERRAYEQAGGVSRSGAGNDLRVLVEGGILRKRGAGPSTRYSFASVPRPARAASKWSEEQIERDLRDFLVGRATWPTQAEFKAAGLSTLYVAASRQGGIRRWRQKLSY
jgi:Fic family protein